MSNQQSIDHVCHEGGCLTTVVEPKSRQCQKGFVMDNNFCVRSEIRWLNSNKVIGCEHGYWYSNGRCVKYRPIDTVPPVCPTGYRRSGMHICRCCESIYALR